METNKISNWWKIIVKHLPIVGIGVGISTLAVGTWLALRHYHIVFNQNDVEWVLIALLPVLGIAYGGLAVKILEKVINENDEVRWAVESRNFKLFKKYAPRRIKKTVHFLLGIFSIAMVFPFLLIDYKSLLTGIWINFSISFTIAIYWQVATVLDDPFNEMWEIKEIPADWQEWLEKRNKK